MSGSPFHLTTRPAVRPGEQPSAMGLRPIERWEHGSEYRRTGWGREWKRLQRHRVVGSARSADGGTRILPDLQR